MKKERGDGISVIVKGMEMPESCYRCPMANDDFYLCGATEKYLENDSDERRPDWCPLIEAEGRVCDSCKHNDFPDGDRACLACCEYYDSQYKEKLHKLVDDYKKKYDEEAMRRLKEGMTNVEIFLDELGKLPHDNGSNLTWWAATDYDKRAVKIVMRDRTCKPIKTKTLFCSFDDIYAMPDPRYGAALAIENLYYDFGEHIIDEKLLMSPDEAASILREFTKDFEEYGAWDIEDDVLITALKVAINCLEVKI